MEAWLPMNAKQIWQSVLDRMQLTVSQAFFTTWFGGTTAVSLEERVLTVSAVSTFTCSQLKSHYYEEICYILSKLVGPGAKVEFVVGRRDPEEEPLEEP